MPSAAARHQLALQRDAVAVAAGELEDRLDAALQQDRGRRTAPRCARAPAPSVTLTASARPFSGAALAIRSAASHDTGGAISAVMTKRSAASLSLRVGITPLFSNSCPDFKRGQRMRHAHLARSASHP